VNAFSSHLSLETLTDLAEGRLPATDQARAQAHLADCARCAEELADLQQIIHIMRTDDSVDAPANVIARAQRLFRPHLQPETPSLRQRLVAALAFDNTRQPLALGVRSGQPTPRQLLFAAGEYEVEVRMNPVGDVWQITGQVLGPSTNGYIELRGPRAKNSFLNALGEFMLAPVPAGEYALLIHLARADIEIPTLTIGG